jgi:phosphonate transport system ATP-binding protein
VALQGGQVAFDLPAAAVTRERLERLYAQHEHELRGDAPLPPGLDLAVADSPAPAVMHCR